MWFYVFIVLAGCAVRCDNSGNYYVIEMPEEDTTVRGQKPFNVYWNVPTMQCKSKRIPFTNLSKYGIVQNTGDSFRGESVTIMYDPGLFPALLKNETSGKFKFRNGGVPQEGNITNHLEAFRMTVEQSVPDEDFHGIGIIDFESWRPIFRQNFGVLLPYKNVSVEIERKLHWWWPETWIQREAKLRFEEAAMVFMKSTIRLAKEMRPKALWGYYGFPYCFNVATNNPGEACPANVVQENNQINWLWSESTALYPSVYSSYNLSTNQLTSLVRGRVKEASRVRRKGAPILPYFWFRYRDDGFMSQMDLQTVLKTLYKSNASGFIIWGSSNDVNTVDKCNKLLSYVDEVLGPAIAKYAKYDPRIADQLTTDSTDVPTDTTTMNDTPETTTNNQNNESNTTTDTTNQPPLGITDISENDLLTNPTNNTEVQFESEFHRIASHTNNEEIVKNVEEELNKKSEYHKPSKNNHVEGFKENNFIEMLLNILSNSRTQIKMDSNRDLVSTENHSTYNLYYTTVPLNNYIPTSEYSVYKLNTDKPVLDMNEETKEILTLSDIILRGYSQSTGSVASTEPIILENNNYSTINTLTTEVNGITSKYENESNEFTIYVHTTNKGPLSTGDGEFNITDASTQSEYVEYNDDLETVTQSSSTTNDSLKRYYKQYIDVVQANVTSEPTEKESYTSIIDTSNDTYSENLTNSTEMSWTTTEYTPSTDTYTKDLNNSTDLSTSTSTDEEIIKTIDEATTEDDMSIENENLVSSSESTASTDDLDIDMYDDVTGQSILDILEESSKSLSKKETTDDNFSFYSSTSSPDKVVVYTL
ncbi:uncharacterized protein [Battus philenor]|uniref:uncharacterized protein n=1 Tax=Battus philenor TaxID=42288 RepID=UPI0035CEB01A